MPDKWDDIFRGRFWSKVDRSEGSDKCWAWLGAGSTKPGADYGHVKTPGGRQWGAHRVAYVLSHGVGIPDGMFVCHHCDNPRCCNPSHLFVGTHQDNVDDKVAKGRQARGAAMSAAKLPTAARGPRHGSKTHPERWARGVGHPNAKFNVDQVRAIRHEYEQGGTTLKSIGDRFGVGKGLIHRLVRRLTYADVI